MRLMHMHIAWVMSGLNRQMLQHRGASLRMHADDISVTANEVIHHK